MKSNAQNVSEKVNFIHKVSEIKQLNNWWSRFISVQFHALFALDLGRTTQIHVIIVDRFYIALFSAFEQTHCARM